jgi:peptidoglycan/LPS O-acetylase OafA/YrhL
MGTARLAIYLVGLVVVVAGVWVLLTQTPFGRGIPASVVLAVMLLLVGIGVMAAARSINDRRSLSRVVHEGAPGRVVDTRYDTYVAPPAETETVVEERRYD